MAFSNFLKLGYENRPVLFQPGALRLILVRADAIQALQFASPDEVDVLNLRAGEKLSLFNELDNLAYYLTPESSQNGVLYNVEIGFTAPIQTTAKNRLFDSMRNTDLVAIVEDKNFHWWLLGLTQPLRMTLQEQKVDNDLNQYTVKLTCRQRDNVKRMTDKFIASLTDAEFNQSVDTTDGPGLDIHVSTNNSQSGDMGLPNNFQNTITAPPTNYVVLDSIGVVFATPGSTIKLPPVALNGQQHTVKDYLGLANVSAIRVLGNGSLIDGSSSYVINTDYGAATFTYNNGAWLVNSFVN